MKTPLRYAGGKSKAIRFITPFVADHTKVVSPFIGGGSLEVHWASLGKKVIGYDTFDMLVNFWNVLLDNPLELADELSKISPDKETYEDIKEKLLTLDKTQEMLSDWGTDHYKRDKMITLDDVTRAAYYFFNHNASYGPGYLGWASDMYLKENRWRRMRDSIKNFKCKNLKVKQMNFSKSIPKHKNDFLYLDPPYYLDKDSDNKMFAGIYPMRNIPVHHDNFDHEKLRDLLNKHEGGFVLSYNNCETIREWYSDFDLHYPKWSYSMGNGETRIGKNRIEDGNQNSKDSHEILIHSKVEGDMPTMWPYKDFDSCKIH